MKFDEWLETNEPDPFSAYAVARAAWNAALEEAAKKADELADEPGIRPAHFGDVIRAMKETP